MRDISIMDRIQPTANNHAPAVIVSGLVVAGRRTKQLITKIKPGQIALIDHIDFDSIAAQGLIDRRPAAVIDVAPPMSGRYPNRGPGLILNSGIPLFQLYDPNYYDQLSGKQIDICDNGNVIVDGCCLPISVQRWDRKRLLTEARRAQSNLGVELAKFADNTLQFVREEASTIIEPSTLPELVGVPTFEKRHVVIVVRGAGYKEDLASIKGYLQDVKPILIGVDGGADALLEIGLKPHIIIGDMDSVSDKALLNGSKLIVHAYRNSDQAPGQERLQNLGAEYVLYPVAGTSEDAAMLLAYERGAELIVAVGTHSNLEDFLDKGRSGMASTFLTRLKVGSRLVDARGVSRLHQRRVGVPELGALILSAGFVLVALTSQSPVLQVTSRLVKLWLRLTFYHFTHLAWHWKLH